MPAVDIGQKAPDFTLPGTTPDKLSLHDVLKDKTAVIVFYVFDFSSV